MKNSTALALNRILKSIADSSIKVFVPILIYQNTGSVFYAFMFLAVSYLFNSILYFVLKSFLKKHSALAITIHAIPIIVMEFLLLLNLNVWLIIVIAFMEALQAVLYYSIKYIYAYMDPKNNVAKFEVAQYIGKIVFVIISAVFLDHIENSLIFIVTFSSVFYIASSLPILFRIKFIDGLLPKKEKISFIDVQKKNKYWNIFHIFNGIIYLLINNVLPIYLFVNNLSYSKVGIVIVAQYLINILANYLTMFIAKKGHGKLNVIIGSILGFVCMLLMITLKNSLAIYIMSIVASFGFTMIFTYMFHEFVDDQKQKGCYGDAIYYRDAWQTLSRSSCSAVFLIFPSFVVIFVIGMVANLLCGPMAFITLKNSNLQDKSKTNNQ